MSDENQTAATNVIGEAADAYYRSVGSLPDEVGKRVSIHMLRAIFDNMVIPAINKARQLDREGRNER